MLTVALCRFSVLFGKYFLKITQPYSACCLIREWLASVMVCVVEIPDDLWNCRLNARDKLTTAMFQGSGYAMPLLATCLLRIAPGLETKRVANFSHRRLRLKIIPLLGNKVSSRNRFQINEGQNLLLERQETLTQIATRARGVA